MSAFIFLKASHTVWLDTAVCLSLLLPPTRRMRGPVPYADKSFNSVTYSDVVANSSMLSHSWEMPKKDSGMGVPALLTLMVVWAVLAGRSGGARLLTRLKRAELSVWCRRRRRCCCCCGCAWGAGGVHTAGVVREGVEGVTGGQAEDGAVVP